MTVTIQRDGITRQLDTRQLRDHLVNRFGVQRATTLYTYHQLLTQHGVVETQRVLGPAKYVDMLVCLREAGFDV